MKICSKCNIPKPLSCFYRKKAYKDGYEYVCKACQQPQIDARNARNKGIARTHPKKNPILVQLKDQNLPDDERAVLDSQWRKEFRNKKAKIQRDRYKSDPIFRAIKAARARVAQFLKNRESYSKQLGCPYRVFIMHMESQFQPGMTWETYGHGPGTWQIDHVKSLALAYLEGPESFAAACRFENLRPLWWEDHIVKTNNDIRLIREKKSVKST